MPDLNVASEISMKRPSALRARKMTQDAKRSKVNKKMLIQSHYMPCYEYGRPIQQQLIEPPSSDAIEPSSSKERKTTSNATQGIQRITLQL